MSTENHIIGYKGDKNIEAENTLFSSAKAKVIDLISEGEISGLINGKKSVFLDNTPLENSSGADNFTGAVFSTRVGTNTQDYIPGYEGVEQSTSVNIKVTNTGSPGSHTATLSSASNYDAIRVAIYIPALADSNNDDGNMSGSSVGLKSSGRTIPL